MASKHLLIVFHSQSGNTEKMAQAILTGAQACEGIEIRYLRALEAGVEDLLWAHALLLGTPENMGYMSGALKDFFDRTFYPVQGKIDNIPYGIFISAGNDGTGALMNIQRIARGYPFRQVLEPIIARAPVTEADLLRCHEMGQTLAAGLEFGIF